jgi:hypothetical protein
MDMDKFETFRKERYERELEDYHQRAYSNQQQYKQLQWALVILSIVSAVAVSLEAFFDWLLLKVFAAIIVIVVSGLATVLKTFSYQEKWAFYRKMCHDLENEWDIYQAGAERYEQVEDKEQYFVMRIRALLDQGINTMSNLTLPPSRKLKKEASNES